MSAHNLLIAEKAWGLNLPRWLKALAEDCDSQSQTKVAMRLGCSKTVINQVLRNAYPGDMPAFIARARGAYEAASVICPVVGEITLDRCQREQSNPTKNSSPIRAQLWNACRDGSCEFSKKYNGGSSDD